MTTDADEKRKEILEKRSPWAYLDVASELYRLGEMPEAVHEARNFSRALRLYCDEKPREFDPNSRRLQKEPV